jgi:membrane-associated phospholipid phosphatase
MMEIEKKSPLWPTVRRELFRLSIPLAFAVTAGLAIQIDCPISQWWIAWRDHPQEFPKYVHKTLLFVRDLLTIFENFGNGMGVAVIAISIFVLDPARRWAIPRLLGCAYGAGLAANGMKMLLVRTRPNEFDFLGDAWSTFGAWLPGSSAGSMGQSFPSAHAATAVGLAAGLAWLYPRGRWLFFAFALLTGCQRIQTGAHFLSDVLAGAALGSLVALAFLKCGWLPGWMERLEDKWKGPQF